MTEDECRDVYRWILGSLEEAGATDLAQEIEVSVARGVVRAEKGETKSQASVRVPMNERQRLAEALRMLVAAASVPLMIKRVADHAAGDDEADGMFPPTIKWMSDDIDESRLDSSNITTNEVAIIQERGRDLRLEPFLEVVSIIDELVGDVDDGNR